MNKSLLIAGLPLVLGGCLPVPLQLASTGFSAIALMASGKSTTDHVISATVKEDCAMYRVILMQLPCREYRDGETPPETVTVQHYPGDRNEWQSLQGGPAWNNSEIAEADESKDQHGKNVVGTDDSTTPMFAPAPPAGSVPAGLAPAGSGPRVEPASAPLDAERPKNKDILVSSFAPATIDTMIDVDALLATARPGEGDLLPPVSASPVSPVSMVTIHKGEGPLLSYTYDRATPPALVTVDMASSSSMIAPTGIAPAGVAPTMTERRLGVGPYGALEAGDRVVVLGSFRSERRAERLRDKVDAFETEIVTVTVDGQVWHRVVVGPVSLQAARGIVASYRAPRSAAPWITRN